MTLQMLILSPSVLREKIFATLYWLSCDLLKAKLTSFRVRCIAITFFLFITNSCAVVAVNASNRTKK